MNRPGTYVASYGSDAKHCVDGPGHGFGYYAGTLWPECRFSSEQDAKAAAILCNTAYAEGYKRAQREMRIQMGFKE